MLRRTGMCLLVMALVLFVMSCTKLSEPKTQEGGGIAIEKLVDVTSIPSKSGQLISVSHRPDLANVFQLWFQDENGNVSMMVYNMTSNQLQPEAKLIPQK